MAQTMRDAGANGLIVHARKAWLQGLSPKENRDVPPLDYGLVYQLKRAFPNLPIAINGGIADLPQTQAHLAHVDGVMMGRAAYHNPMLLLDVDPVLFGTPRQVADGFAALEAYYPYIERELLKGVRLHSITRHLLGMFTGMAGARAFRRHLSSEGMREGAGLSVLRDAVKLVHPALQAA